MAKKLAEENSLILAEAMTLYHMPLHKKLYDLLIRSLGGKIVKWVEVIKNMI